MLELAQLWQDLWTLMEFLDFEEPEKETTVGDTGDTKNCVDINIKVEQTWARVSIWPALCSSRTRLCTLCD